MVHSLSASRAPRVLMRATRSWEKVGKPPGLIRYDTEARFSGAVTKILRPRSYLYGALLLGLLIIAAVQLHQRPQVDIEIFRAAKAVPFSVEENIVTNQFSFALATKGRVGKAL